MIHKTSGSLALPLADATSVGQSPSSDVHVFPVLGCVCPFCNVLLVVDHRLFLCINSVCSELGEGRALVLLSSCKASDCL